MLSGSKCGSSASLVPVYPLMQGYVIQCVSDHGSIGMSSLTARALPTDVAGEWTSLPMGRPSSSRTWHVPPEPVRGDAARLPASGWCLRVCGTVWLIV